MKNKKILFIFLMLALFTLLCTSKSFASTSIDFKYNDEDYSLNYDSVFDNKCFVIVHSNYYNCFMAYSFNDSVQYFNLGYKLYVGEDNRIKFSNGSEFIDINHTVYKYKNDTWVHSDTGDDGSTLDLKYFPNGSNSSFLYCPYTIYNIDGSIFFRIAPQVQGIVAQQVETVKMSQTLVEVIALLPMILVVLVSLVGLRKGLKMLETFLRQS